MKKFKKYLSYACISFTLTIFSYAILVEFSIAPAINNQTIYELSAINFIICLIMFFTDKLPFKTIYSWIFISLADIFLIVFVFGGLLFKMFPLRLNILLIISAINLLVFFIIFGAVMIKNHGDADKINKKLKDSK